MPKRGKKISSRLHFGAMRFAALASNLDRFVANLNETSGRVLNLQITLLFVSLYVGIIVGATTDEQLLRLSPVTLPIFNVLLPIQGFYLVSPLLLVALHLNLLFNLSMHSERLRELREDLGALPNLEKNRLVRTLSIYPLNLIIIQPVDRERSVCAQRFLRYALYSTTSAIPLAVMLWTELRFLPFHSGVITTVQATVFIVDLCITWFLWRVIVSNCHHRIGFRRVKEWFFGSVIIFPICVAVLGVIVQGYSSLSFRIRDGFRLSNDYFFDKKIVKEHYFPFDLDVNDVILLASDVKPEIVDDIRNGQAKEYDKAMSSVLGFRLEDRDLRYAQMKNAILVKANLRRAKLDGANLTDAILDSADMREAVIDGATLTKADLRGVDLRTAKLRNVILTGADLRNANLGSARLDASYLMNTNLRGADFGSAKLRKTNLTGSRLDRSNFNGATISGATFDRIQATLSIFQNLERDDGKAASKDSKDIRDPRIAFEVESKVKDIDKKSDNLKISLEGQSVHICDDSCEDTRCVVVDNVHQKGICSARSVRFAQEITCRGRAASVALAHVELESDGECHQQISDVFDTRIAPDGKVEWDCESDVQTPRPFRKW